MADAMSCEEATDLLALNAVGALEAPDRDLMECHVATCESCKQAAAEYADLASLLPGALDLVPPPARLRRRLMAQVYAEATASARLPWWRRLVAAIPAGRAFTAIGALAVVAAIAFGVYAVAGRSSSPAPVAYTVSGTTATGILAVNTSGTQAVLTVKGLSALPGSEVYEVWLIPPQGSPKGVAFLSPGLGGAPWTAVVQGSIAGYKSIAATVEPMGGSPSPSNTEVLSGQLSES
ncbi:MAG: anti-sigma factor [Candidatus Dormibacteria bacterium]